jgi:hypothetical protein
MPERVTTAILSYAGFPQSDLDRTLHILFVHVMSPENSGARIDGQLLRRKDILPDEFLRRGWVFPFQRIRQVHLAVAALQVLFVNSLHRVDLQFQPML